MIVCGRCGKENQHHFKFCLGCGAKLDEIAPAPVQPPNMAGTSSPGLQAQFDNLHAFHDANIDEDNEPPTIQVSQSQPVLASEGDTVTCTNCGLTNPADFKFCGNCGTRLKMAEHQTMLRCTPPSAARQKASLARLVLIRPDGSDGGVHEVFDNVAVIGRETGPLFDGDIYLSPKHMRITIQDREICVEDTNSLNGVFVRIGEYEPLENGDVFRVGQELLRFDAISGENTADDGTEFLGSPNPGYWGRISLIVGHGIEGSAFPLMGEVMSIGREKGDVIFSDDGYVSGAHAKISFQNGQAYLTDLGSSNGTYVRIKRPTVLDFGTFILIGQQLFRVDPP
ncbi:MAG: FHA domain-containing protein [Pseudomonadota bacterium]